MERGGPLYFLDSSQARLELFLVASIRLSGNNCFFSRNPSAVPWSARMERGGPLYFLDSSQASYSFHASIFVPRYPVNAFSPQGHFTGLQMGANADTAQNIPGFFRAQINAP